jgi:aminopeptidase-like protein
MLNFNENDLFDLLTKLFPINRSLSGDGVSASLELIKKILPDLEIKDIPSGEKVYDWEVPEVWNVSDAYIKNEKGMKVADLKTNNLHLMGYSTPINTVMNKSDLLPHIYFLPQLPDAIPYVTSYYKKNWGFCVSKNQWDNFGEGPFEVVINSNFTNGNLNYGELIIPGYSGEEILLSTYICHPSMANDNLTGPVVLTYLLKWLASVKNRKYTYRAIFIPETIGSIYYICKNINELKNKVKAGFVLTCLGDERNYSYLSSRNGNTLTDKVAIKVLKDLNVDFTQYSYLENGSDERQFCFPGVDLPIGLLMRSKFGEYPEYHTSLDNLNFVTKNGLFQGFNLIQKTLLTLEYNDVYKINTMCEPFLGKRNLYPEISTKFTNFVVKNQMNVISQLDGSKDILEISNICDIKFDETLNVINLLKSHNLVSKKIQSDV